jgi:hypothetical protein
MGTFNIVVRVVFLSSGLPLTDGSACLPESRNIEPLRDAFLQTFTFHICQVALQWERIKHFSQSSQITQGLGLPLLTEGGSKGFEFVGAHFPAHCHRGVKRARVDVCLAPLRYQGGDLLKRVCHVNLRMRK